MTNIAIYDVLLMQNICALSGKKMAMKRSTAMNTVIQDEARSMANKKIHLVDNVTVMGQ